MADPSSSTLTRYHASYLRTAGNDEFEADVYFAVDVEPLLAFQDAEIARLRTELDTARKGLFHRITGWDVDGQQAVAIADELQHRREWMLGMRPLIERVMAVGATAAGYLQQHHADRARDLYDTVQAIAQMIATVGWAAESGSAQSVDQPASVGAVARIDGIGTGGSTRVSTSSESTSSQATDRAVDGR